MFPLDGAGFLFDAEEGNRYLELGCLGREFFYMEAISYEAAALFCPAPMSFARLALLVS